VKHRSAADFIPSFEIDEGELALLPEAGTAAPEAEIELPAFLPRTPREPPPDLDAIYENGRQAGLVEARAEAEAAAARQAQEAEAALEQARLAWTEAVATPLAAELPRALDALTESLAETTGRLLRPFLEGELSDAASRALIDQIRPLLSGQDGALIRVSGPAELLATLRSVFPAGSPVEFTETEAVDVAIVVGETVIETRIAAWVARLRGQGPDRRRRPAT
jgi:hypothetical protein